MNQLLKRECLMNPSRYRFINLGWLMKIIRSALINGRGVSSLFENRYETSGLYSTHLESVWDVLLIAHARDANNTSYFAPRRGQELISVCKYRGETSQDC